ncbi:MAG: hypothetical protein ACXV8Y_02310 [Acidimicrobiia bacterium]
MSTSTASDRDVTRRVAPAEPGGESRADVRIAILVVVGLLVGFTVALVALARPRWFPILDLAQTEMRLRDVFSAHPPLIGLPGRIGTFQHQGSHPGPLSFWALAPLYQLFGASAWAMQAATAALNLLALGIATFVVRRRGGTLVALGFAAVVANLTWFFGPSVLTQAWNPYLPLTWFVVFAVGTWSVLCDDIAMLPLTAFAACFCLQTHISYLGIVGGLSAVVLAWVLWSLWKRPGALGAHPGRWILAAAVVVVATWTPPVLQELTNDEGNLTLIWRHFTNPPEVAIGFREGLDVLLVHLNPWRLVVSRDGTTGAVWPGVVFLAVWAASVVLAVRLRRRVLVALDVVLAVGLALGLYSVASIFGYVWYYLMLWAWVLEALMVFATVWAVGATVCAGRDAEAARAPSAAATFAAVALAAVTFAYLFGFALDASTVEPPTPRVSRQLGALAVPTVRAIDRGRVPGGGRAGRYQVTIVDTVTINAPGYGLVSELERAGIHAGFPPIYSAIVRPKRIVTKQEATAVVHYSVGADVAVWRAKPGVVEIARVDLRTPAEKREAARLLRHVHRELLAAHRTDLARDVNQNVFTATFRPDQLPHVRHELLRVLDIGKPAAVFIGPRGLAE